MHLFIYVHARKIREDALAEERRCRGACVTCFCIYDTASSDASSNCLGEPRHPTPYITSQKHRVKDSSENMRIGGRMRTPISKNPPCLMVFVLIKFTFSFTSVLESDVGSLSLARFVTRIFLNFRLAASRKSSTFYAVSVLACVNS